MQSLVEGGQLAGGRGAYRLATPVEALQVPASVQAVLSSRIDRLPEREKQVLQTAAVIGKTFGEALLGRVMASVTAIDETALGAALSALAAAEFLYEAALYPQLEYSFKHPLTQEVAQRSQLRERRVRVHAAVAQALEEGEAATSTSAPRRSLSTGTRRAPPATRRGGIGARRSGQGSPIRANRCDTRGAFASSPLAWRTRASGPTWRYMRAARSSRSAGGWAAAKRRPRPCSPRGVLSWRVSVIVPRWRCWSAATASCASASRVPVVTTLAMARRPHSWRESALIRHCARRLGRSQRMGISMRARGGRRSSGRRGFWRKSDRITCWARSSSATARERALSTCARKLSCFWGASPRRGTRSERRSASRRNRVSSRCSPGCNSPARYWSTRAGAPSPVWNTAVVASRSQRSSTTRRPGWPRTQPSGWRIWSKDSRPPLGMLSATSATIARDRRVVRALLPLVLAGLAEAHLALGEPTEAVATAREGIDLGSAGGCLYNEALAQLALAAALLATDCVVPRAEIESALERAEHLVASIEGSALSPRILELRGRLAAALGDAPSSDRTLREALERYRAIGATGHAERLAQELNA